MGDSDHDGVMVMVRGVRVRVRVMAKYQTYSQSQLITAGLGRIPN